MKTPEILGYLVVAIEDAGEWVSQECAVDFDGCKISLRPETEEDAPSIVIGVDRRISKTEAYRLAYRFLSALAWVENRGFRLGISVFSSAGPTRIGKNTCQMISDRAREYLPAPSDDRARLALALYREGLSAKLVPYQFLSFAKIINILHRDSKAQQSWINENVSELAESRAKERVAVLEGEGLNVGKYLYESGRCAIAHAFDEPIVNPDEPDHLQRLYDDLPLIMALARRVICVEMGVKTEHDVWKEHLYELEGFRSILDGTAVANLRAGAAVQPSDLSFPERLSLRLRGKDQLASFDRLTAEIVEIEHGVVTLRLVSDDEKVQVLVNLDFPNERLISSALTQHLIIDDNTPAGAMRCLDALQYALDYMCNGVVEVVDSATQERLGRSEVVLEEMTNMRIDFEWFKNKRSELEARLEAQ